MAAVGTYTDVAGAGDIMARSSPEAGIRVADDVLASVAAYANVPATRGSDSADISAGIGTDGGVTA